MLLVIFYIVLPASFGICDRWEDPVFYKLIKAILIYTANCILLLLYQKVSL